MEARKERAKSDAEGTTEAGLVNMSPGSRKGAPYRRSEAEQSKSSRMEVLMPKSTNGRCSIQLEEPEAQALEMRRSLRIRCCRSMRPLL